MGNRSVAVLDIGKTNIKLSAVSRAGAILETVSVANRTLDGPPYKHPDLAGIEDWFLAELGPLARRHGIAAIVACGHGSAGMLVDDDGPVVPSVDYENEVPPEVNEAYAATAGPIEERGGPIMPAASHLARQLFWLEREWPQAVARARWMLGGPQYWAWRLCGVAASERTYLAAQSHFWNVPDGRFTEMVDKRGWRRLLPDLQPAWKALGRLKPDIARRLGLTEGIEVLCGIHDSSANFYRYQEAGLHDLAVISTGTWIVGLGDAFDAEALAVTSGMTWNADVHGRPLTGMLAMGGREFAVIAGSGAERAVDAAAVGRLVETGVMALPSFVNDDGPFRGSALRGRIVGPRPDSPGERRAVALLYVALLTDICLDLMGAGEMTVLDGSFVTDPLYASLVAALRPGRPIVFSTDAYGTAAGAALLADHGKRGGPVQVALETPAPLHLPGLELYRQEWRECAGHSQADSMEAKA